MAYFLFLLVNATLFIRPAEIVPALLGWEIYFYVIITCLIVAAPDVLRYFTAQSLETQPITLCVFGLLIAILIPSLIAGDIDEAWRTGFHFAKIIVYYLLLVSLITTPARLKTLLISILIFSGTTTALAVLRYHDVIQLNTIQSLEDNAQGLYGSTIVVRRLQGTGIFQDPNDLCVLLAALVPLSLYFVCTKGNLFLRIGCGVLLPLFGYAILLTGSRGGFIALAGGLGGLTWMCYGWRKAALIGAVGLPLLLIVFGGRQTELSTSTGTAQTRVELWREWLTIFRENAIYGKGMTLEKEEEALKRRPGDERKEIAHNSYLQGFADLGVLGGCLFLGAFMTAIWSLYRFNPRPGLIVGVEVKQIQPYLLAGVAAYCFGMASLSICYVIPTYLILGLSVAFTQMATRACLPAPTPLRFDFTLLGRFATAGICCIFSIYVFVRYFA